MTIHPNLKIVRCAGVKNSMKTVKKYKIKGTDLEWICPNDNQGHILLNGHKLEFFYGRNVYFYKGKKYKGTKQQCEDFIRNQLHEARR